MPSIEINGGQVAYDVLGDDAGVPVVLTPGGRASGELVRSLGERLAAGGAKVLLWDRPNGGRSDVQFSRRWPSEAHMHADTLQQLIRELGWGPTLLAGGSSGGRVSIITAIEYPEVTRKLFLWHIAGGVYSSMSLACGYILGNISTARQGGMQAVIEMPEWKQRIDQNPRNHERLLAIPQDEFVEVLRLWLDAYVPTPGQAIPGVSDELFAKIVAPTEIVRSDKTDLEHPLETCLQVNSLIEGSRIVDSPWAENAWEEAFARSRKTGGPPFDLTADVAPPIIEFLRDG
jgi:pimeloyl-ACP methyl ester carboxylesterase